MLFLLTLQADEAPAFTRYCVYNDPPLRVAPCAATAFDDSILAFLNVSLELNKTGWMFYGAEANPAAPPKEQMRAIGYGEGVLFWEHIANHRANIKDWFLFAYLSGFTDYPDEVYQFYADNLAWTRKQAAKNRDKYWRQVSYTLAHFDGLVLGYQQSCNESSFLSELDLFMYMSSGDLLDVVEFALPETRERFTQPEFRELGDHCSGLVRIHEDEAFLSQVAWFTYGSMTRVAKHYTFDIEAEAKNVKFSSYPGFSYSFDDWYQADSGLMWLETTDSVYNTAIYELCSPETLMTWIRAPLAGRLARDAEEFQTIIRKYNSGTYNNQWIVFDGKRFEERAESDVLWVLEQIPGKTAAYDASDRLYETGYFPSYNIPSQREMRIISGYPKMEAENRSLSYEECARAKIFARDAPNVMNVEEMRHLMRYNDYEHDELAYDELTDTQEPSNAISARYDLRVGPTRKCFGAFDAKVGEFNRATGAYRNHFISSPAYDNVPAWSFPDPADLYCPRRGLQDGPFVHEFLVEDFVKGW